MLRNKQVLVTIYNTKKSDGINFFLTILLLYLVYPKFYFKHSNIGRVYQNIYCHKCSFLCIEKEIQLL